MTDPLTDYLEDHLAGASLAIDLLQAMKARHDDESLSRFAGSILPDIEEDERTLRSFAQRIGSISNVLKEAATWLTEKVSRFKLSIHASGDLGTFEALEVFALGIQGKLSLWRALQVLAAFDDRLSALDLEQLIARAEDQYNRAEHQRLSLVVRALKPKQS